MKALRALLSPLANSFDFLVRAAVWRSGLAGAVARVEDSVRVQRDEVRVQQEEVTRLISSLLSSTSQNQEYLSSALHTVHSDISGAVDELRSGTVNLAGRLEALHSTLNQLASLAENLSSRTDLLTGRAILPCGADVLARTPWGWLVAPGTDLKLLAALYETGGVLEPGTTAVIERLLTPGETMLDVGAHIGLITLPAARRVGERGRVIAVEPVPQLVDLLRRSLVLNELEGRVILHECAAGSARGRENLSIGKVYGHSSLLALDRVGERIDVTVAPLDDLVPPEAEISLVKLDVEGYELNVWRGMRRIIAENPDLVVIVEFGPSHLARSGEQISDWLAEFTSPGFTAYEIDEIEGICRPLRSEGLEEIYSVNLLLARQASTRLAKTGLIST